MKEMTRWRRRWRELGLLLLGFAIAMHVVDGSIHEYMGGKFTPQMNAFFFHGGSEGLYASKNGSSSNGKSFIQFESVTFWRTEAAAARRGEMQQKTGLIEAIIVEIKDREKMRRSMGKLELYRKFTNCLAISVLLSIAWIGYELYFNATDPLSELWERAWLIPAFLNGLSYLLLAVICILWAPSQNATRYAYSEETGDNFDDEEIVALTASAAKASRDLGSKLERKERRAAGTEHVFGPGEDLEEDKIA